MSNADNCPLALIDKLARDGAISDFQASELVKRWEDLDEECWSHPHFRAIPEYTRAMLGPGRKAI